jgi:hypothetical protein
MGSRSPQSDSLANVELALLLEEAGLDLTEEQWTRLKPYLVDPYVLTWQSGSLRINGTVIAATEFHALAVEGSTSRLAVGELRSRSELVEVHSFHSPEMAIRKLLSTITSEHGI